MPIEIGLLPSQQDSFEHHEELSKLLNETEVFYVPHRHEMTEHGLNTNPDAADLAKRFDEDLSNKHLIVTFRDIGYSLFLDSVKGLPDENDRTKIRVSGKMIVDGICVQFLGCFDCSSQRPKHADQQIQGVGRVQLDPDYYRQLSLAQVCEQTNDQVEQKAPIEPSQASKTRPRTAKSKESTKPITRSRTISENMPAKNRTSESTSPPSTMAMPPSRPHLHSPGHMPYPLRSPRTMSNVAKQQSLTSVPRPSAPFPEHPPTAPAPLESSSTSHPPEFSSPISIPSTSTNTGSLSQLASLIPSTQSHSLPTYFLPASNLAYITSPSSSSSGMPFDFSSLNGNTSMVLITHPTTHSTQPVLITPLDYRSLSFAHYSTNPLFAASSNAWNGSANESMSTKRPEDEEQQQQVDSAKQFEEQLPFKKRRYAGQRPRMATLDDDEPVNK